MRTLPPVSVPSARSTSPEATALALPAEDPPATWSVSTGFFVGPKALVSDVGPNASSSMFVLPTIVAPALRKRSTTSACSPGTTPSNAREPHVISTPRTHVLSLMATVRSLSLPVLFGRVRSNFASQALWGASSSSGRYGCDSKWSPLDSRGSIDSTGAASSSS
jgi:hypothetical protein